MRFPALALIVAAALILSGCLPQRQTMGTDDSWSPEDEKGLIVFGQSSEAGGNGGLFSVCPPIRSVWLRRGNFAPTEPSSYEAVRSSCPERTERPVAYNVIKLAPGTYVLSKVIEQHGYSIEITEFKGNDVPRFTVAKGDVIYLGNILFAPRRPHYIVAINRDEAAAHAALSEYKNVAAPLVYRPLVVPTGADATTQKPLTQPPASHVEAVSGRPLSNPVAFKAPPIGTRVYLDTGGSLQVAAVTGRTIHTVNASSREEDWVGSFFIPGNAADSFDRALVESIWPLQTGKSVTFQISRTAPDGAKRAWEETITVVREEDITTEAGQFRTVVVEMRQRSLTGIYESLMTRWYAPEVGFIVKSKLVVEKGSGNASAWTVTKVAPPGS
jgi:hypothetical protein